MLCHDIRYKRTYCRKNCWNVFEKIIAKKQIKQSLGLKKAIKRKSNKLRVKQKGYNNTFNSWTDKKDIIIR